MTILRILLVWLAGVTVGSAFQPNTRWPELPMVISIYAIVEGPFALVALLGARVFERAGAGMLAGPVIGVILMAFAWQLRQVIIATTAFWILSYLLTRRFARSGATA